MKGYYKDTMVVARMVEGEGFLVPVADDMKEMRKIYKLNDLGWFIWQSLDRAEDPDALSSLISLEFAVERGLAHKDAQSFLDDLVRVGAVLIEEEKGGP